MRRVVSLFLALVALSALSCPSALHAQSASASLTGYITDPSKAVILDARVIVINAGTNLRYEALTDKTGSYYVTNLPAGTYRIEVEKLGFKAVIKPGVILHVQDTIAVNFELALGSVSETMTVEAGATQINMTDGTVSTTVDRQFVSNLPLNGRSFQSLILLTPGVVATPSDRGSPGEFSVNGQRQNANYFTVDGVSANTGVATFLGGSFSQQAGGALPGMTALGTTASLVSVDALEEFKIQTSTYSAEFGRQPGGQVQLVTRSGTNQHHGTAFEYLRNDAMDAENWFDGPLKAQYGQNGIPWQKPELRQNQFGGTFSGPITLPKLYNGSDKTFFFFSYEGQRLRIPVLSTLPVVPALWLRQAAAPVFKPILNAYPLPTGPEILVCDRTVDPNCVNPPTLPSGGAPFGTASSNPSSVDAYSIRIDHMASSTLRLFGRYSYTPSNNLIRDLNQLTGSVLSADTVTLGATFSLTPRVSNETRFNWTRNRGQYSHLMDSFGGAVPITLDQLVSPYSGPGAKQAYFSIASGAPFPLLRLGDGVDSYSRQLNIVDNVSWAKGPHQLSCGIDWRRLTPIYGPTAYGRGSQIDSTYSDYPAGYTSKVISGTALDTLSLFTYKGARPIYDNYAAYAQDTWKISPRLTLDIGLRWEINPAPHDANGVTPVIISGITGTDVSQAAQAPPGTPFYKTNYTAFAPRLGAAYQLNRTSGRETVLRGGFGMYYDLGSNMASQGFSTFPFRASSTVRNVSLPLSVAQATPPPFPTVQLPLNNVGALYALNPDLKLPYTLQWSVALEQALGNQQTLTLSYVAAAARRLTFSRLLNTVPNTAIIPVSSNYYAYRPNPNFGDLNFTSNSPTSDYQSLQVRFQRRLSRGLQALVNYTWSHAIDQTSYDLDTQTTLDRSNAAFDVRQNFSAAITYDLPKLSGAGPTARFVKSIINGWSVDSIFTAQTGRPLDLILDVASLSDGNNVVVRPDVVPGVPVWIKDSSVPGGQRLNPNAFASPPSEVIYRFLDDPTNPTTIYLRQGTLARNSVRVPGIYQLNMGVRRRINLTDRWNLQFSAESFNVFNHPLFGNYDTGLYPGNPTLGVPTSMLSNSMGNAALNSLYQVGGPRSMQISLRLSF